MKTIRILAALLALAASARAQTLSLAHTSTLYFDVREQKLREPEGVACTARGDVVIADSGNGRLLLTRLHEGAFSAANEIKLPQLGRPVRVQIDSAGDVFSLDRRGRRLVRVGLGGQFKGFVEIAGEERQPVPVAFRIGPADQLYLLDAPSARVLVTDPAGRVQRRLPLPRGEFVDIAVNGQGTLYALDAVGGAVWTADKGDKAFAMLTSRLHEVASFPSYAAITDQGLLLIVDSHGNGLVVLGPDGSFLGRQLGIGWGEGALYYPAQLCATAAGAVVIADRNNNRVQAFQAAR